MPLLKSQQGVDYLLPGGDIGPVVAELHRDFHQGHLGPALDDDERFAGRGWGIPPMLILHQLSLGGLLCGKRVSGSLRAWFSEYNSLYKSVKRCTRS